MLASCLLNQQWCCRRVGCRVMQHYERLIQMGKGKDYIRACTANTVSTQTAWSVRHICYLQFSQNARIFR